MRFLPIAWLFHIFLFLPNASIPSLKKIHFDYFSIRRKSNERIVARVKTFLNTCSKIYLSNEHLSRILAQLQSIFGRNWWDGWLMKWLKIGGRKLASMQAARYTIVDHWTKRCEFLTRFLTFDTYSCSRMARTRRRAIWMGWDSALTIQGTTALRYSSVSYRFQYIFVYLFSGEIYRVKTFLPAKMYISVLGKIP